MITKTQYLVIKNWVAHKSWKNFKALFILGFNLKGWQRPLWKVWRIIRNTWITKTYEFLKIDIDKLED